MGGPIEIVRIFLSYYYFPFGAFSGPRHAQKVMKLCRNNIQLRRAQSHHWIMVRIATFPLKDHPSPKETM